ncbi:integrase-like protein [Eoetvoesiella caeni]|uniref:Integrase-like protein n=1 Tax=Eoetvoesiella caeni TaxID=645616 RepID=A0A366H293_9BURK|nr:integrase-like protein [Eoetvoesiella caeni]
MVRSYGVYGKVLSRAIENMRTTTKVVDARHVETVIKKVIEQRKRRAYFCGGRLVISERRSRLAEGSIRTYEGWLYLAVVVDLFSRQVVGWSMDSRMSKDLVLQALLAAVWRRKPKQSIMVHSDQGSQFTRYEWAAFLASHNLQPSMSRRGNCHDNAVAESFFQLLERERIKRKIYKTRELARQDIFDYIEMFYNPIRRHGHAANLSPVNYERQYFSEATNCL